MRYAWEHFKTITKHKLIVGRECIACGQIRLGLLHDLSKYSPTEFLSSARFFQGDRSPIEKEKAVKGYSLAWQHHKGHNPHHWEYWIDFDSEGGIIVNRVPYKYVVEMVCDWIGAGMVYSNAEWTQSEPLEYYRRVRHGRHIHPDTDFLIELFLRCLAEYGLASFHRMARDKSTRQMYEEKRRMHNA